MKFWFERGAWVSQKTQQKYKDLSPESIKSIAIIRHAALGDLILTRAFITEARKFFPNASITLSVVSNYQYGVPDDLVDRVHVAVGSDQRNLPKKEQIKIARNLGPHDIIFDMAVSSRSILLCVLNKAKIKVSFPYRNWQRIFYDACVFRSDMQYEAETLLDMLRLFGANVLYPPDFQYANPPAIKERPYIVYFTTASETAKCWSVQNFAGLLQRASQQYPDYEHIILEGLADWESTDELMNNINAQGMLKNVSVQKASSLDDTVSLLKGALALVGNDTGIRNLAICCYTPTVGIFFSKVLYRYWPRFGKHDAVFNADGSVPSVESVLKSMTKIVNEATK